MEDDIDDNIFNYKIVVIGPSDTGKTNLINRYVNNSYDDQTYHSMSATYVRKRVTLDNGEILIMIFGIHQDQNVLDPY